MSWTDERVQILSRLWLEGKSASQIATALGGGLTRNAVIGKVHRLGLAGRIKPAATPPSTLEDIGFASLRNGLEHAPGIQAATRKLAGRTAISAVATTMAPRASLQGNTALAISTVPEEAPQVLRVPEDVVVPLSLKVTIVELRESMCKWPIGDPSSSEFRYCGSPAHGATPYCQHHGKLAYQPAQDRRREREKRPMLAR